MLHQPTIEKLLAMRLEPWSKPGAASSKMKTWPRCNAQPPLIRKDAVHIALTGRQHKGLQKERDLRPGSLLTYCLVRVEPGCAPRWNP